MSQMLSHSENVTITGGSINVVTTEYKVFLEKPPPENPHSNTPHLTPLILKASPIAKNFPSWIPPSQIKTAEARLRSLFHRLYNNRDSIPEKTRMHIIKRFE
ncbi:hypothetical protein K443DRAFT_371218 [Laccaria amethystina LaAM-08-1]|uniref:Uncharacterized protein n=1 Tax=Laccaria amethystina LaAM-08-1 TaxID=1095629 RepID=A0A0C9X8V4_9AGAR|nr:hypothetical protein K443DRAFT_371218 [Laccaria amethystina LaAM-08-1]